MSPLHSVKNPIYLQIGCRDGTTVLLAMYLKTRSRQLQDASSRFTQRLGQNPEFLFHNFSGRGIENNRSPRKKHNLEGLTVPPKRSYKLGSHISIYHQ